MVSSDVAQRAGLPVAREIPPRRDDQPRRQPAHGFIRGRTDLFFNMLIGVSESAPRSRSPPREARTGNRTRAIIAGDAKRFQAVPGSVSEPPSGSSLEPKDKVIGRRGSGEAVLPCRRDARSLARDGLINPVTPPLKPSSRRRRRRWR